MTAAPAKGAADQGSAHDSGPWPLRRRAARSRPPSHFLRE